jgi:hypothetical protein
MKHARAAARPSTSKRQLAVRMQPICWRLAFIERQQQAKHWETMTERTFKTWSMN